MFSYLIACTSNNKARCGGNVESILAVATSAYNINIAVGLKRNRNTCLKNTITKTKKFINRDSSHLNSCEQSRNLCIVELTPSNAQENLLCLFTSEFLMIEQRIEKFVYIHNLQVLYYIFYLFKTRNKTKKDLSQERQAFFYIL